MPPAVSAPPIRRRLVGKALRRYRETQGFTLKDVARMLGCDASKMSRIETGERGIRDQELRELLDEYGVADPQQAILAELADPRGAFGWSRQYADVLPGAWRDYLILETAASKLSAYEAQRVPGLLQTRRYARALAEIDPSLDDNAARERATEAVLARQRVIGERRTPVHLVIGQAALHQQVGSQAVMDEQLAALAWDAENSNTVTMQVMPFESGAHAAAGDGSLAILQVTEAPGLGIVHLGGISGGICLEGQGDLAAYTRVFEQLRAFALTPSQSALLLCGLAGN